MSHLVASGFVASGGCLFVDNHVAICRGKSVTLSWLGVARTWQQTGKSAARAKYTRGKSVAITWQGRGKTRCNKRGKRFANTWQHKTAMSGFE